MAISNAFKTELNKMNRVAKDTLLGTVIQGIQETAGSALTTRTGIIGASGSVTISGTQSNASAIVLATGLGTVKGFVVQRYSGGSAIVVVYVDNTSGSLTVTTGSAGQKIATGEVINWMAW